MNAIIDQKSKSIAIVQKYISIFNAAASKMESKADSAAARREVRRLRTIASNLKRGKVVRAAMLYRRAGAGVRNAVAL